MKNYLILLPKGHTEGNERIIIFHKDISPFYVWLGLEEHCPRALEHKYMLKSAGCFGLTENGVEVYDLESRSRHMKDFPPRMGVDEMLLMNFLRNNE